MNCLLICTEKLGYRLVEKKLRTAKAIRAQLCAAASRGKSTVTVFSDERDVADICAWRKKQDPGQAVCSLVVARDGVIFYAQVSGDAAEVQIWERLFQRDGLLRCMICCEDLRDSRNMIECDTCNSWYCEECDRKCVGSVSFRCPYCTNFNIKSSTRKAPPTKNKNDTLPPVSGENGTPAGKA